MSNVEPSSTERLDVQERPFDSIERAEHYNLHPSGVECFKIVRHMNFCVGGAVKYLWRAGHKGGGVQAEIVDLRKAKRLIEEEIDRLEATTVPVSKGSLPQEQIPLPDGWVWKCYLTPVLRCARPFGAVTWIDRVLETSGVVPADILRIFGQRTKEIDRAKVEIAGADGGQNEP